MTDSLPPPVTAPATKSKKRSPWIGLGIIFGVCAAMVLAVVIAAWAANRVEDHTVLRLELKGPLPEVGTENPWAALTGEGTTTIWDLTRALRHAATDESVGGVVLDLRAGGVGLAQLQELESAFATLRAAGKWSAAFVETAGEFSPGTGVYALATLADHVVVPPSGEVNLVGLRAEVPFLAGSLRKLKLGVHFEKREAYKNAADMFTRDEFSPEHEETMVELLSDLQKDIVEHIAARRHVAPEKVQEWLVGGPYAAADAKEAGLIDEIGYWDAVDARAKEKSGLDEPFLKMGEYISRALDPEKGGTELALIVGQGQIHRGDSEGGFSSPDFGSDTITEGFRKAREAEVKGVLFRVSSPGGSYVASDLVRREVELTRAAKIPVVVSMGDVAASGGYFVSMQADRIFASPATITGSIGVFAGRFATREFFREFLGVTFDEVETTPSARFFSSLDAPDEATQSHISTSLDRIYRDFVDKAASGRHKTYDELHAVARGRVWSGRDALERGLVDELGGMHEALAHLKKTVGLAPDDEATLIQFPKPKTGLEALLDLEQTRAALLPQWWRQAAHWVDSVSAAPADRLLHFPWEIRP